MGDDIGELFVTVGADLSGLQSELSKGLADANTFTSGLQSALGSIDTAALDRFNEALAQISIATTSSAQSLDQLATGGNQAKTSLGGVGEGASSANGLLGNLTGTLGTVNPQMGNLASVAQEVIGAAGGGGFLGMAGAITIAVGAMAELAMGGGRLVTEMSQLAAVTGLSTERADFWAKALSDVGGNAQSLNQVARLLSNQLDSINQTMLDANPLTQKQADMFNLLGGAIKDADGNLLTGGALIEAIIPKLAAMTDANQRAVLGQELFGRSWAQVALLVQNFDEVSAHAEAQQRKLGDAMGVDGANAVTAYNEKMTDLKTDVEVLEVTALPLLMTALEDVTKAIDLGEEALSGWRELLDIITKLQSVGEIVITVVENVVRKVFGDVNIPNPVDLFNLRQDTSSDRNGQQVPLNQIPSQQSAAMARPDQQGVEPSDAIKAWQDAQAAAKKAAEEAGKDASKALQGIGSFFDGIIKHGESLTISAKDKVDAEAEAAAKKALADAEKHEADIVSALKDGVISLSEAMNAHLTPAEAAHREVLQSIASRQSMLDDAYYQTAKAVAGLNDALSMGAEAFDRFSEHLAEVALKANQSALGGVLGEQTKEMAGLQLQRAQAVQRLDQNAAPGVRQAIQRDIDAIDARIKAEMDHVAVLKAQGDAANHLLLTDKQRDFISGELIKNISDESGWIAKVDTALDPLNTGLTEANRAAGAFKDGLAAVGVAIGPHIATLNGDFDTAGGAATSLANVVAKAASDFADANWPGQVETKMGEVEAALDGFAGWLNGQPTAPEWKQTYGNLVPQGSPSLGPVLGPPSPRAVGGDINPGMPYLVGERGPELVIPSVPGYVLPNYITQRPSSAYVPGLSGGASGGGNNSDSGSQNLAINVIMDGELVMRWFQKRLPGNTQPFQGP